MKQQIGEKLRRVSISPMGRNIINCVFQVGESVYEDYCITSDKYLLMQRKGDIGFNDFIGRASSLASNIKGMAETLEDTKFKLNEEENEWLERFCKGMS